MWIWSRKKCYDKIFGQNFGLFFCCYNMATLATEKQLKNSPNYSCEICDFFTCKLSNYKQHLATDKHRVNVVSNENIAKTAQKQPYAHTCEICQKNYESRSGLWRHKKTCSSALVVTDNGLDIDSISENCISTIGISAELICELIKDNNEMKQMMIQFMKTNTAPQTNIVATNNSHNKTTNNSFNLNFYLNETCKDAMDIMEFVDSIKLTIEDLERVGELGYADGISHIFVKHLEELEKELRPLHCSDLKREVIYVRCKNQWLKHILDKQILIKAIKKLANENIKMISEWRKLYPDCTQASSRKNDTYLKIVSNSMCGIDAAETEKNMEKIVRNIARCVVIDKN